MMGWVRVKSCLDWVGFCKLDTRTYLELWALRLTIITANTELNRIHVCYADCSV